MWRELWTEHRKGFLFAVGMLCFLMAGLLAQFLPLRQKKPEPPIQTKPAIQVGPSVQIELPSQANSVVAPVQAAENAGEKTAPLLSDSPFSVMEEPENQWIVYVTGSVRSPGVYKMPSGSRFFQLVEAAGGVNNFADLAALNMAAPLEDGLHVHVPKKGERMSATPPVAAPPRAARLPSRTRSEPPAKAKRMVDVNGASQEELTSLKGIGPVLAKNIIEHRRKNGRFRSVEDLLQVKGIGTKKLEGLRDQVTLGP